MKKPKIETEEQQPRKIIRADKAPTEGYSLVVDGHFKSHHDTVEAAEEAGRFLDRSHDVGLLEHVAADAAKLGAEIDLHLFQPLDPPRCRNDIRAVLD